MCAEQPLIAFNLYDQAAIFGIISIATTALLVWILGFKMKLGAFGIGAAFSIPQLLVGGLNTAFLLKSKRLSTIPFGDFQAITWKERCEAIHAIRKVGGSIFLNTLTKVATPFVLSIFAGTLGVEDQAAINSGMQIVFVMIFTLYAFSQVISNQQMGRALGSGKYQKAANIAKKGLFMTLISALIIP